MTYLLRQSESRAAATKFALHLSNILDFDFAGKAQVLDVQTARKIHSQLCGPVESIEAALSQWSGGEIVTWAPTDTGQLLQVAAAMRNLASRGRPTPNLILAVPLDLYPGCEKLTDALDLWSHPLMNARWKDVAQAITIHAQPTRIVLSGLHGPMHHITALAFFSLVPAAAQLQMRMDVWRDTIFTYGIGPVVMVDIATPQAMMARELMGTLGIPD